nr:ribosomal lysine n-methyltransferase 5 [Quercus suber]
MLDPRAPTLDLRVGGRELSVAQSPGLLQSARGGGTTGAAAWQSGVRFAEWLASATAADESAKVGGNDASAAGGRGSSAAAQFDASSTVLELGAGLAGVVGGVLATRARKVVLTDQPYCLRALRKNVEGHCAAWASGAGVGKKKALSSAARAGELMAKVEILPLDWEADDARSLLVASGYPRGVDLVVACDCVYNSHLIRPFTQTCVDVCSARRDCGEEEEEQEGLRATVCIVVQQLRQSEIFEEWLGEFMKWFRVVRLPGSVVGEELGEGSGFVVHAAILKGG